MIRLGLVCLSITCCLLTAQSASGQVLSLDKKPTTSVESGIWTGRIVEQKKYSFSLKVDDEVFQVQVPRGTPISMKLNRPRFDFDKGLVWVAPKAADDAKTKPETEASSSPEKPALEPVAFHLPQPAFLTTEFAHAAQMKRVMGEATIRLNNYTVLPSDPGAKMPSADDRPIRMSGKLNAADDAGKVRLLIGERQLDVILGHRGAQMTGFSIATLDPNQVSLKVKAAIDEEGILTAETIELIPVPRPQKAERLADQSNSP